MQIKSDTTLTKLSQLLDKPEGVISDLVIKFLKSIDLIHEYSPGAYVDELMDSIGYPVETLCGFLGANNSQICTYVRHLIVVDVHDCPECGSKIEFHDTEFFKVNGRNVQKTYYKCNNCKEVICE